MESKNLKNLAYLEDLEIQRIDQEIREQSRAWSPSEWEEYLQSLETGVQESQPEASEIYRHAVAANVFDIAPATCPDELAELIKKLVDGLTERQKFVIEKYFFEGRSERQISKMLLISRQGVFDLKKRAIRQLKSRGGKALADLPLYGVRDSKDESHRRKNEDQQEGEVSC